jgi:CheY-like chemotaxis protein
MVLICTKCEARLQLDEAKAPSRPFSVRCPKCQTSVNVQAPPASNMIATPDDIVEMPATPTQASAFEHPIAAPPFKAGEDKSDPVLATENTPAGLDGIAKLLAEALRHADSGSTTNRGRKRPAWDRRKALVCASPAYRETIARSLSGNEYEVFVAENMAQALGRMREEPMDIVILDASFDPLEQGVAFVTREVKLLRPSERRRMFFVYLTTGVRTLDLHAAFLHNVNLVVNSSDVEQLPEALEISLRNYNELYRDFTRALDVAPI